MTNERSQLTNIRLKCSFSCLPLSATPSRMQSSMEPSATAGSVPTLSAGGSGKGDEQFKAGRQGSVFAVTGTKKRRRAGRKRCDGDKCTRELYRSNIIAVQYCTCTTAAILVPHANCCSHPASLHGIAQADLTVAALAGTPLKTKQFAGACARLRLAGDGG